MKNVINYILLNLETLFYLENCYHQGKYDCFRTVGKVFNWVQSRKWQKPIAGLIPEDDICLPFYFILLYASTAYNCLVLAILRYEMVLGSYTNLIILLCTLGSQPFVLFFSIFLQSPTFYTSGYCSFTFTYSLHMKAG